MQGRDEGVVADGGGEGGQGRVGVEQESGGGVWDVVGFGPLEGTFVTSVQCPECLETRGPGVMAVGRARGIKEGNVL